MKRTTIIFVIGFAAGLLIAPDEGKNTRRKLWSLFTWLPRVAGSIMNSVVTKIETEAAAIDTKLSRIAGARLPGEQR